MDRRRFLTLLGGATAIGFSSACEASRTPTATTFWDATTVHTVGIVYDDGDYQTMMRAYLADGTKNWIKGTLTVDGSSYPNIGLKLKGNSSLRGVNGGGGGPGGNVSADRPEGLPWRVRLDKYVKQDHLGAKDIVVRADNSQTSLNEAVALDLIGRSGLATQLAVPSRFTANGRGPALRLVIQNPDDDWLTANFPTGGQLYKAEANGDYSFRGDDASAYADVFDIEAATGADDYRPLIAFLQFVNQSTDAAFVAELGTYLEVDAFATYLAVQDLVANSDDIDGPGNNSYLRYGPDTKRMTVVSWDENLAFGGMGGGAFAGGGGAGGGGAGGGGRMGGGMRGRSNALADRFRANRIWPRSRRPPRPG